MKSAPTQPSPLASRVTDMKEKGSMKKAQPQLQISAHVDEYGPYSEDLNYRKEEAARITKRIRTIKSELSSWDNDKVAALAKTSLENELKRAKLRLQEHRLRIS